MILRSNYCSCSKKILLFICHSGVRPNWLPSYVQYYVRTNIWSAQLSRLKCGLVADWEDKFIWIVRLERVISGAMARMLDAGYWVLDVSVIVEDRLLALYLRHWEPARASAPDSSAVYSLRGWRSLTWQGGPERCTPRTSQTPPPWWSWGPRTHSPGPLPPPCSHPKTEGKNLLLQMFLNAFRKSFTFVSFWHLKGRYLNYVLVFQKENYNKKGHMATAQWNH